MFTASRVGSLDVSESDFEREWAKVARSVFGVCLRRLENRADAEDMCADIRYTLMKNYKYFRGDSSFATWAMRITVRKVSQKRPKPIGGFGDDGPDAIAGPAAPEIREIDGDLGLERMILAATSAGVLTDHEADLMRMNPLETSWRQIELALGTANVAKTYMRARKRFIVYLLLNAPDVVGGLVEIGMAYEKTVATLSPAEQRIFSEYVLRRKPVYRTVYRDRDLRSACQKVAYHLRLGQNRRTLDEDNDDEIEN